MINPALFFFIAVVGMWSFKDFAKPLVQLSPEQQNGKHPLMIRVDSDTCISVYKSDGTQLVLRQIAKPDERPYIHPIYSPDGKSVMTEFRPGHHIHQTGLYWGLKKVNGRDYFMNGRADYWKRISLKVIKSKGESLQWQTIYHLLDSAGNPVMKEEQTWSIQELEGRFILDFKWKGTAKTDVQIGKFYVGGLFVRMPWRKNRQAAATNSNGQIDQKGEGQRAEWLDVGLQLKDRDNQIRFTVLDHPSNTIFPTPWRIDSEFGFGPSRQIVEDWSIKNSDTETIRYRIIVSQGDFDRVYTNKASARYQSIKEP